MKSKRQERWLKGRVNESQVAGQLLSQVKLMFDINILFIKWDCLSSMLWPLLLKQQCAETTGFTTFLFFRLLFFGGFFLCPLHSCFTPFHFPHPACWQCSCSLPSALWVCPLKLAMAGRIISALVHLLRPSL